MEGHFAVRCLVTAEMWIIDNLSYSEEPVMRFDYQMLLKPTPKLTGWIRPSGYVA